MKWLWRLVGAVPRDEWDELMLKEEDARKVRYSTDLADLLRGIAAALPEDSVLYLEGAKDASVQAFLTNHPAAHSEKIQVGTIWPAAPGFHLQNRADLVARLIEFAERLPAVELADHLVVYRGEQVLISAYDLGEEEIWISQAVEADAYERLLECIGGRDMYEESGAK